VHKDLELVCGALDSLAKVTLAGWSGDQTFAEAWGWNCPALTRHDLAALPARLARDIREANPDHLSDLEQAVVRDVPRRLQYVGANTVPNLWGGNNGAAVAAYTTTLAALRESLAPLIGWQRVSDPKAMPAPTARRLRALQAEIDQLLPDKERLSKQVAEIVAAHEAAESLPVDMERLKDARKDTAAASADAAAARKAAEAHAAEAADHLKDILARQTEAQRLVAQCEEAYRINTTKGLAAAFDLRASQLALSLRMWVLGLIVALMVGAALGAGRIQQLSMLLGTPSPSWGAVWMNLLLSLAAVGAPVWFAWIATRQIGQRFRLAEDYAFKASVAKAYEGYRREAARLDEALEQRLFSSALTRLEEAPLRLVESETPGSPWHEFVQSPAFQRASQAVPELWQAAGRFLGSVRPASPEARVQPETDPDRPA